MVDVFLKSPPGANFIPVDAKTLAGDAERQASFRDIASVNPV